MVSATFATSRVGRRGWAWLAGGGATLTLVGLGVAAFISPGLVASLIGSPTSDAGHAASEAAGSGHASTAAEHRRASRWPVVRVQQIAAAAPHGAQSYTGVVRARYEADLAFRVGGKIISRNVEVGNVVEEGAVLFRLDPTDYELAVKAAAADLAAAEAEVVQTSADELRVRQLHERKALTLSDLDRAQSLREGAVGRRDRAKESLTLARNRLAYCELKADGAGVVLALPAESGQVVADGQVVARLARDGEREAVVDVPENQTAATRSAQAVVTLWSSPDRPYDAVLRELSPVADPDTRTYRARFTIRDAGADVALGMTATVHLAPPADGKGYAVPLASLARSGDRPAVWIVARTTGSLTLTPVVVQEYRHGEAVLSEGVHEGEWIVTAGVQKLDAGLKVRVWKDQP